MVIFSEDCQCWIPWQATGDRSFFFADLVLTVCGWLPKRARKKSSLEEDGINALGPLIGQCVAESLGRGVDSWEKIDLWLLHVNLSIIYWYIFFMYVFINYWFHSFIHLLFLSIYYLFIYYLYLFIYYFITYLFIHNFYSCIFNYLLFLSLSILLFLFILLF